MAIFPNLTTSQRNAIIEVFNGIIDNWGTPCKIVYPPKVSRCVNCITDNITNKSSGKWHTGGPASFPMGGICPVCGGDGITTTENSETVQLVVYDNPRKFIKIGNVAIPDGAIQTKGFLKDLSKVFKASYMIRDINILAYRQYRYTLFGEPVVPGNIIQDRYFLATWTRNDA